MKIALVHLPKHSIDRPPMALAILTSVIKKNFDYDIACFDLSLKLYQDIEREVYYEIEEYLENNIYKSSVDVLVDKFSEYATEIKNHDLIAISVFCDASRKACEVLCKELKKYYCKIVIGGQGLVSEEWCKYMLDSKLINDYIWGEGEYAFVRYLNGLSGPGINNHDVEQIDELDLLPIPDYSLLNLEDYTFKELYVTGSRGCVRKCGYCDIPFLWKKYRYRSGQHLASELIHHYEKYGVTDFWFTDSLVNGSLKHYKEFCYALEEYYKNNNTKFSWKGQYIFRRNFQLNDEHFRMTSAAGGVEFYVGVETGSDKIRWVMDKKFTNEDVTYHLEMFKKYKITCMFLMISGYITETKQDHLDTVSMFKRWQKFVASGTIIGIDLGNTLAITPNTPLEKENLSFAIPDDKHSWVLDDNTYQLRVKNRLEMTKEAMKYHWPITNNRLRLKSFIAKLQQYSI